MQHMFTITIRDHVGGHADTIEIYEDGIAYKMSLPAGEGRERVEDILSRLTVALWGEQA